MDLLLSVGDMWVYRSGSLQGTVGATDLDQSVTGILKIPRRSYDAPHSQHLTQKHETYTDIKSPWKNLLDRNFYQVKSGD